MIPASLADVLARADVWRGSAVAPVVERGLASGFPELDAVLPGQGWPAASLVEVLLDGTGIGELTLLLPALAAVTQRGGWLAAVQPPQRLHAPAWRAAGIDLARLVVVDAPMAMTAPRPSAALRGGQKGRPRGGQKRGRADADPLWVCQQILQAGCVEALLAWLPLQTDTQLLRRLQLAAEAGGRTAFLFRPAACAAQSSPAPLRLVLRASGTGLAVQVIKRRGAPLAAPVHLVIPRPVEVSRHAVVGSRVSPVATGSAAYPTPV